MYKAAVRALVRHGAKRLNAGDPSLLGKIASTDVGLAFPGDNSWAAMYRPVVKGRERHDTHRGAEEFMSFAQRFVDRGIQFAIEDILVNGPPWRTRVAVRVHVFIPGTNGHDVYNNRAIGFLESRWGRLVKWEDYEDTERVAALDAAV